MEVIKRDGRVEEWQVGKLFSALQRAGVPEDSISEVVERIIRKVGVDSVHVTELHSIVENVLMASRFKDIARNYIEYRSERDRERQRNTDLLRQVEGLIYETDEDVLNQNANKPSRLLPTHRDLLAGILSRDFGKHTFDRDIFQAHTEGTIYIHDLDYSLTAGLHNCGVYDYEGMLREGFTLGNAKIEQPNSIGTATTLLSQIASTLASSSYGGQSIHRYTELLRPYALKSYEKLGKEALLYRLPYKWVEARLRKEIYDAHQTFIYQINTICGSNGQSAFCTISIHPSDDWLVQMINEEYFKCHMAGLGKDKATPVFPKVIYFLERGVNLDKIDPHYEEFKLALECSAKRIYPDFVMAENNKKMTGFSDVVTPMGCRSFVNLFEENGEEKYTGRFNLGVVSVNVAHAACKANGIHVDFFNILKEYCQVAFKAHMSRIERFKQTQARTNPLVWMEGAVGRLNASESVGGYIYNGRATASLGYVGVYEAMEVLGDTSREMALRIVRVLQQQTERWKVETNIAFSLYGTPAESLCYTFANVVKKDFPEIGFKHDYLTNSFHLPVRNNVDWKEKLDWESDFYMLSSGGNVNNIELPNMSNNMEAFEAIVRYAYDKVNYLIVNQPVDQCFECGFEGEFDVSEKGFCCPSCGNRDDSSICVIRRVSGYISSPNSRPFNRGKQAEVIDRIKNHELY